MIRLDARDVNRLMSQSGGQEVRAGISWFDNRSLAVIRIVYASSLQPGCSFAPPAWRGSPSSTPRLKVRKSITSCIRSRFSSKTRELILYEPLVCRL